MIHSGLPFFNPLLGVGGVAFPWALQTHTTPPSSPPPSPGTTTRVSSFTIDAILGRRQQQQHDIESGGPVARSLARRREERLSRSAPYAPSGVPATHAALREGSNGVHTGSNSGGCSKAKAKRVRTIFTAEQLERLEAEFARQQYMVGPERLYLAAALQLTEAQVKVWFQNRRIKWRKAFMEQQHARLTHSPEDGNSDSASPPVSPLRAHEETSSEGLQHIELLEDGQTESESSSRDTSTTTPVFLPSGASVELLQQTKEPHFLTTKISSSEVPARHRSDITDLSYVTSDFSKHPN